MGDTVLAMPTCADGTVLYGTEQVADEDEDETEDETEDERISKGCLGGAGAP